MKLIKLVYISYVWYYAIFDKTLFREKIEAWKHGPVVPSIYHEFKRFGSDAITSYATEIVDTQVIKPFLSLRNVEDKDAIKVTSWVWDNYKNLDTWKLRDLTHEENSPWSSVYKVGENNYILPNQLMADRASGKIREFLEKQ